MKVLHVVPGVTTISVALTGGSIDAVAVSISKDMVNALAVEYLSTLLGKQLRIHTTDTRMFVGEMKCTDGVINTFRLTSAHAKVS